LTDSSPHTLRTISELVAHGLIAPEAAAALQAVVERYAVAITPAMVAAIAAGGPGGGPDGGIARQFVPDPAELLEAPEERADPIADQPHSPLPGLVHRHPDRVLLLPTLACAVYCRFCFRRATVGPGAPGLKPEQLAAALDYIRDHRQIWEVILTGGDPLVLAPRRLADLTAALAGIAHVGVVRVHSRLPLVAPERVSDELVAALAHPRPAWLVLHVNHPDELTPAAAAACARLRAAGIPLLSQTVLLKGINHDPLVLGQLFRRLIQLGVKPYYLHHPDLAPGTSHFRPTLAEGLALVAALRQQVSGLCQPTYVLDLPGGHGKVALAPGGLSVDDAGRTVVTAADGTQHVYPPGP